MSVRPERIAELDAKPGVYRLEKPGRQFSFIGWNTRRPPFNDARVRRALTMAIDRDKMVQVVARGVGQVAAGPVPPFHWSYDSSIEPLPHSVDSARALLAEPGFPIATVTAFAELPNGKEFRAELKIAANNQLNRMDIAELIRSDLAEDRSTPGHAADGVQYHGRPCDIAWTESLTPSSWPGRATSNSCCTTTFTPARSIILSSSRRTGTLKWTLFSTSSLRQPRVTRLRHSGGACKP